ncbi:unnamed protein product [Boreogadus saida]
MLDMESITRMHERLFALGALCDGVSPPADVLLLSGATAGVHMFPCCCVADPQLHSSSLGDLAVAVSLPALPAPSLILMALLARPPYRLP